jgi:hypothetical protein
MERIGRAVAQLKLSNHGVTDEKLARAAWAAAVGKKIANRTKAVALVRNRLVVEVEDQLWQRNLFGLRQQVLRRLDEVLGRRVVEELEFRIAVPRLQPARAEMPFTLEADEADGIRDPVLRTIYKSARKKATA